jgi:phosphate starvation-inducible PhoH-like protein
MAKPVRASRKNQNQSIQHFQPKRISPLTENQKRTFDAYDEGKHLVLHGVAGTGKSFVSLYLAYDDLLAKKTDYEKIVIIRSVVPSRDIGFLPGSIQEKIEVYEEPYKTITDNIFGRGDAYGVMKKKGQLEFLTTSFLRGTTLSNCIVIVDEFQNCNFGELDTIITRIGTNSKVIFCGDYRQSDLDRMKEKEGMQQFLSILERMDDFAFVDFTAHDIVRSGLVKQYILAKIDAGL